MIFRCFLRPFFGGVATEWNVGSIQYLLCFRHIGLRKKKRKKSGKARRFVSPVRGASGSRLWDRFGTILGAIWEPCWPQNRKNGHPDGGPKTGPKKRCFQVMRHDPGRPDMARQRGGWPLKTIHIPCPRHGKLALHFVP